MYWRRLVYSPAPITEKPVQLCKIDRFSKLSGVNGTIQSLILIANTEVVKKSQILTERNV